MNIFFFGGTSMAAKDLINSLEKKYRTFIFSRKKIKKKNFYYFDLNKKNNLLFKKFRNSENYLFFFSSFVPMQESKSTWERCSKTNIYGLIELLKKTRFNIKKIILASSCAVYGNQTGILTEKTFLKPESYYAISKLAQENIIRIFCLKNKIGFLCFRLGYVYGKEMNNKRLIKKIIIKNKRRKKFSIFNKNLNLNLIHTKDIGNSLMKTFKRANGVYNLSNIYQTKLGDFYNIVKSRNNLRKINLKKNNFSPEKLTKKYPSIKFLSLEEGIKKLKYDL